MRIYFQLEVKNAAIEDIAPPALSADSYYGIAAQNLSFDERVVAALTVAPYIKPQLLDAFFLENATYHRRFSEFGGMKSQQHSGFLPTAETAIFLLSGADMDKRIAAMQLLFSNASALEGIVQVHAAPEGEPPSSGSLTCTDAFLNGLFGLNR